MRALANPKYDWRTVDGIAKETGLAPDDVVLAAGADIRQEQLHLRGRGLVIEAAGRHQIAVAAVELARVGLVDQVDHVRARIKIEPARTMDDVLPVALARALPKPVAHKGAADVVQPPTPPAGRGTA